MVVGPVVSQVVRPHLPERRFDSPHLAQLADPGPLLSELLFTGYYPVRALAGLRPRSAWPSGRADLRSRRVQAWLVGAGLATAVAATAVSRWLTAWTRSPRGCSRTPRRG